MLALGHVLLLYGVELVFVIVATLGFAQASTGEPVSGHNKSVPRPFTHIRLPANQTL
jgi:hypothetical protein